MMWWPQLKSFIPVIKMNIFKDNCKFLEVQYHKPISIKDKAN